MPAFLFCAMTRITLLTLLLSTTTVNAYDLSAQASTSLLYFHYNETDNDDSRLNTETGFLPSLSGRLSIAHDRFTHHLLGSLHDGTVDYDGFTTGGSPHRTDTDTRLSSFGYRLSVEHNDKDSSYVELTQHEWIRNILPAAPINGLYEEYRWKRIALGAKRTLQDGSDSTSFHVALTRTFDADIEIDLSQQGFGIPVLELGKRYGFEAGISYDLPLVTGVLSLQAQTQHFGFGRSRTAQFSNGLTTIAVAEPESDSWHTSFRAGWSIQF